MGDKNPKKTLKKKSSEKASAQAGTANVPKKK